MDFDLFDFLQLISILVISVVGLIVFLNQEQFKNKNGHYTVPEWNFFLKKWWAEYEIKKLKDEQRLNLHDLNNYANEDPKILQHEDSSDSQLIYGSDQDGNSLLLKLTRRRHRIAEVWLILRLKNGEVYTLPNHPDTRIANANTRQFEAAGVRLECLRSFSRWRIIFNGLLRKGSRKEYSSDVDENQLRHVKFNFIWASCSDPIHWPYDWSPKLMATALATEPWRDGKWINLIKMPNSGGYDQFGGCFGQISIEQENFDSEKSNIVKYELNLPGLRQRRWGPHKGAHLHRTGSLIGVCHDGSVYLIGANSSNTGLTHSQFGNLRAPNGRVYPIDWMNFHLSHFGEALDSLPQSRTLRFYANNTWYTTSIHIDGARKVPLIGGRPFDWMAHNVPLQLGLNGGKGTGIAMLWYPHKTNKIPSDGPKIQRVFYSDVKPRQDTTLLQFDDRDAQSVHVAGGKGASLALLTQICKEKAHPQRNEFDIRALIDTLPSKMINRPKLQENVWKSELSLTKIDRRRSSNKVRSNWHPKQFLSCPDFKVPNGFILSVSAFDAHIEKNSNILNSIDRIQDIVYEKTKGDLGQACDDAQKKIVSSKLSQIVMEAIVTISLSFDLGTRFAIRSSSTGEDGGTASFAGQNETILGAKSKDDIELAIKQCWASVYTVRSVQYRKQNIQPIKTGIAVVIQEMVNAESAGVLFTNEPTTGNPNKIVITANYGLGESVVSGQVDPDVYIVRRGFDDSVDILTTLVGKKEKFITLDNGSSVEEKEIGDENKNRACVSEDDILRLAEIGIVLEKMYGTPRDIEWAIRDGIIYLLQSRPITSLNNFSDWELLHEIDTPKMSHDDMSTTGNIGEVMPGATSPLTSSTISREFDRSFPLILDGRIHSGLYDYMFHTIQYHVTLELFGMMFRFNEDQVTLSNKIQGFAIFGHDFITEEIFRIGKHRWGVVPKITGLKFLFKMIKMAWDNEKTCKEMDQILNEVRGKYFLDNLVKFKKSRNLLFDLKHMIKDFYLVGHLHQKASSVSSFGQTILTSIMVEGSDTLKTEHQSDLAIILSSCTEVESAAIPEKLKEISKVIYGSGMHENFVKEDPSSGSKWLEDNCIEAYHMFKEFIKKNYHRAHKELDLHAVTWGMSPPKVIVMLQEILRRYDPKTMDVKQKILTVAETIDKLKTPKKKATRRFLRQVLPICRRSVQRREHTKSLLVAFVHELRMGFIHLGKMMHGEGLLPDKELIFFLFIEEIEIVMKKRDTSLITKAMRRRKMFNKWDEMQLPEFIKGYSGEFNNEDDLNVNHHAGNDQIMRGTPVSTGAIVGRACVVKTFSEVGAIQAGDILITHHTDIAWSPYFPVLGGVVTEIGGLISHGAVVAREYGLPCVVGVHGATNYFKTGDKVKLIGDNGIVMKVA